jgi:hypothetical protein
MSPDERPTPENLEEESRASIDKARELLDELKIVQEHEGRVLEDDTK